MTSRVQLTYSYPMPSKLTLPEYGYQCYCFSSDGLYLYMIMPSGALLNISMSIWQFTTIPTNILNNDNCYFDSVSNSIITIMSQPTGSIIG